MSEALNYWTLVESVWLPLNLSWDDGPDEFIERFRRVRPEVGHLYAAHWCQSEVCNGGLHQFFSNTTGLLAPEALDGFRAIGAVEWADILAEAMKYFGTPYPRDRHDRQALLLVRQKRPKGERNLFDELDERFFEWKNWEDAANAYARQAVAGNGG